MTSDLCIYCGESTAFGAKRDDGSLICKFVNRIPADIDDFETGEYRDGWACAECAGFQCDECGKGIYLDCETRVEFFDNGNYHYGNYHTECYNEAKHGIANYGENISNTIDN